MNAGLSFVDKDAVSWLGVLEVILPAMCVVGAEVVKCGR